MDRKIWLTWERQRRSIELAKALDIPCYVLTFNGPYILRSIVLTLKTLLLLLEVKPRVVFVQNPSMIAATVVCGLRRLLSYKVVVDRHSNFKLSTVRSARWKYKWFHILSRYTVKAADLTVVTNTPLKEIVERWGGKGFVLQDKLPDLHLKKKVMLEGVRNLVCISSFAEDEPVREVIEAARMLEPDVCLYITGNYKKAGGGMLKDLPLNVRLTGYLSEEDFQSLIYSADILVVLTTAEYTLLCGAYEAVSLRKPLILSDKPALKEYFFKGVVGTTNEAADIVRAINRALGQFDVLTGEVSELAVELSGQWASRFESFKVAVASL